MSNVVKIYNVQNLNKVKIENYPTGSLLQTGRSLGIVLNGKIVRIPINKLNLDDYVTKDAFDELQKRLDEHILRNNEKEVDNEE